MATIRYDNKVAVVTGAGRGLGRTYALLLASRGAAVVVNDLGTNAHSQGGLDTSAAPAQQVVDEIKAAGGRAVANFDSVEDGDKIIKTAIDTFGRVDIVINNAGIIRDVTFHKMTQAQWDIIYKVHLVGAYQVTKAAWPYMRQQGYGRVIMTTSAAGIYGNFGQANYSAAKLALVGFMNTLAIEGRKYNINVNTVAPIAGSRMTEGVLPPALHAQLKPEYITPLVAVLVSDESTETGGLFEVGAGWAAKLRWERTNGAYIPLDQAASPEAFRANWAKIVDFSSTNHPANGAEALTLMLKGLQNPSMQGGALFSGAPKAAAAAAPAAAAAASTGLSADASQFEGAKILMELSGLLDAELVGKVQAIFTYKLKKAGKTIAFTVDLKNGSGAVYEGPCKNGKAAVVFTMDDIDFVKLATKKADPIGLYMQGKVKMAGDMQVAMKAQQVFSKISIKSNL